jgi:hypothetical protein
MNPKIGGNPGLAVAGLGHQFDRLDLELSTIVLSEYHDSPPSACLAAFRTVHNYGVTPVRVEMRYRDHSPSPLSSPAGGEEI